MKWLNLLVLSLSVAPSMASAELKQGQNVLIPGKDFLNRDTRIQCKLLDVSPDKSVARVITLDGTGSILTVPCKSLKTAGRHASEDEKATERALEVAGLSDRKSTATPPTQESAPAATAN
jgi:hypothetical protein